MEKPLIEKSLEWRDERSAQRLFTLICAGIFFLLAVKPPFIAAYPWKALLSAFCAVGLIGMLLDRRSQGGLVEMKVPRSFIFFTSFVLWSFGSSFFEGTLEVARWQMLSWLSSLLVCLVACQLMTDERQLKLSRLFVYGVLLNFLLAFILFQCGLSQLFGFSHYAGSFPDKNYLAEALVVALPFSMYHGLKTDSRGQRFFWILASLLIVLHAFVGGSKSGILGIFLQLSTGSLIWIQFRWGGRIFWVKHSLLFGAVASCLILVTWYGMQARLHGNFVGNAFNMFACRADTWKTSWLMVADHPFFGIGSYRFVWEYPIYDLGTAGSVCTGVMKHFIHAHNEPLHVLVELGIFGLGLILFGFISVGRESWIHYRGLSTVARTRFTFLFLLPLLGLLTQGIFNRPLHWTFSPFIFALLLSFLPTASPVRFSWERIRRFRFLLMPLFLFSFWGVSLDIQALYHKGAAEYYYKKHHFPRSLNESLKAIALTPNNPDFSEVVAKSYKQLGHWVKAKEFYLISLDRYPSSTATLMNLAYVESNLHRFERARYYLDEASIYFPEDPKVERLSNYIETSEAEFREREAEKRGFGLPVVPNGNHESRSGNM